MLVQCSIRAVEPLIQRSVLSAYLTIRNSSAIGSNGSIVPVQYWTIDCPVSGR